MAVENGSVTPTRPRGGPATVTKFADYRIIGKLGQGTFGVVQKATLRTSHATSNGVRGKTDNQPPLVALKQLLVHSTKEGFPITALREITILKQLHHDNVLPISEIVYQDPVVSSPQEIVNTRGCFYTASPYMASDLVGLLENPNISLSLPHIKCLLLQLLTGVEYIHSQHFLHRDIKAANILVGRDGILKIADFGLARKYHGLGPQPLLGPTLPGIPGGGTRAYTGLVVTRWYRPPEILLGERKYTTAVDVWGVGCVFAELFTRKPILTGRLDIHQAQLVFELLGLPSSWSAASTLPNTKEYLVGLACTRSLESRFLPIMPSPAVDLLSQLLALDPMARLTATDALAHEFFSTEPLPTKPRELPSFEDSHEIDKERYQSMRDKKLNIHNNAVNPPLVVKSTPIIPSRPRSFPTGPAATNDTKSHSYRTILEPLHARTKLPLPSNGNANLSPSSENTGDGGKSRRTPTSPSSDRVMRAKRPRY